MDKLKEARTKKALQTKIRYNGEVMTYTQWIERYHITSKTSNVQKYATKKRNGCYAEFKNPKTFYTLWRIDEQGRETGIDVPKLVWDTVNPLEQDEPADPELPAGKETQLSLL